MADTDDTRSGSERDHDTATRGETSPGETDSSSPSSSPSRAATDPDEGASTDRPSETAESEPETVLSALASRNRIGQFASVGAAGAAVDVGTVAALTTLATVQPLAAKAVGAELSIALMFLVNEHWTFAEADGDGQSLLERFLRSHLVRLGGLTVGVLTLFVLVRFTGVTVVVGGEDLWPTVANAIGIALGATLNYLAESLFTWQVHRGGTG